MYRKHIAVGSSHGTLEQQEHVGEISESDYDDDDDDPRSSSPVGSDDENKEDHVDRFAISDDAEDDAETSLNPGNIRGSSNRSSELRNIQQLQARTLGGPVLQHHGSIDLWLPNDDQCLTPFQCFIRKECVDAFEVSPGAALTMTLSFSGGRRICANQVGVQCKFCKHRPIAARKEGAVSFPTAISNIYHSIDTWYRRHSSKCLDIPQSIPGQLSELQEQSRSGIGGNRRYWETSAHLLGLVNHPAGGIRFRPDRVPANRMIRERAETVRPGLPIVQSDDVGTINLFLLQLMWQMETCHYTKDDPAHVRGLMRDQIEIGRPGFQCKYCNGQGGYGRYFPSSVKALSLANSDRNIFKHILKCHSCPKAVKASLQALFEEQKIRSRTSRERKGRRERFFQRVWDRMQASDATLI